MKNTKISALTVSLEVATLHKTSKCSLAKRLDTEMQLEIKVL